MKDAPRLLPRAGVARKRREETDGDEASESDDRSNFHLSRLYPFVTAIRLISIRKSGCDRAGSRPPGCSAGAGQDAKKVGLGRAYLQLDERVYVKDEEAAVDQVVPRSLAAWSWIVSASITFTYRLVTALLRPASWWVNHKRAERIWRREGLKVPQKQKPRARLWLNAGSCVRLRPARGNHVWSYDFEGTDNVLEVYISYLRSKIDKGSGTPLIHTVRGVGYRLDASP